MTSPDENTGRLVLVTKAQRDWMAALPKRDYPVEHELVAAFDAAPSDQPGRVLAALMKTDSPDNRRAVLVALGANEPTAGEES